IDDPYCWAHFFAGRVFLEGEKNLVRHEPPVHYVVCESSANKHPHLHFRTEEELQKAGGYLLTSWTVTRGRGRVEIRIYEVPGREPPPPPPGATLPPYLRAQVAG